MKYLNRTKGKRLVILPKRSLVEVAEALSGKTEQIPAKLRWLGVLSPTLIRRRGRVSKGDR